MQRDASPDAPGLWPVKRPHIVWDRPCDLLLTWVSIGKMGDAIYAGCFRLLGGRDILFINGAAWAWVLLT